MLASPVEHVDKAFLYIFGVSVVILIGITATMIYFVFKYQRDKHPVAANIRGNWKLETVWTVIPTLIALSMFYVGWNSYLGLRDVPEDALEIETIGEMYAWIFVYPDGKETVDELVVPLGKAVKLNVTSNDVLHSIFIPAFRVKVDAVSGIYTYVWFMADRPGEFNIKCTEFCGVGHSDMRATLRILSTDEYEEWLSQDKGDDGDDDW